jgi:hypothetical protein
MQALDYGSPNAVDYVQMTDVLEYWRDHDGNPPETFRSWREDVFPFR